jgi:hypothetical protein
MTADKLASAPDGLPEEPVYVQCIRTYPAGSYPESVIVKYVDELRTAAQSLAAEVDGIRSQLYQERQDHASSIRQLKVTSSEMIGTANRRAEEAERSQQ